ncbi:phytoene desaturase family protein [Kineococcus sp. SYSU DK002]|uniref:phytoene desaturase family protein n=1 Tax=Kineococcus sp. SYSU DK002 TaxID=3383123 RepID=UPI003D7CE57B
MRGNAIVVGSGPNGLSAAVVLARAGLDVTVLEASERVGGACVDAELLGPGVVSDVGSAVHPFAVASPFLRDLPLERHGLRWRHGRFPLGHALDDGPSAVLPHDLDEAAAALGRDGRAWRALFAGPVDRWEQLVPDLLGPLLRVPSSPLALAAFGARAAWPAAPFVRAVFREEPARALFAGMAAHALQPHGQPLTAAFGVLFGAAAHATGWPVPQGGSGAVTGALHAVLREHGGRVETGHRVTSLAQLPPADLTLLDLTPRQLLRLAGDDLPAPYARALRRWRYGPGAHKVDYLLDGPVPWRDARLAQAVTVHVGGTAREVAAAEADVVAGRHPERPFVLVAQQDAADPGRAPGGQRVVWAYAHTPQGSGDPGTGARVDAQLERFAPGFRDRVLARVETSPRQLEQQNANLVGGDVGGGALTLRQQLFRPVAGLSPYRVPLPGTYLCSAATPPGGGVHGMCGFHAATLALRDLARTRRTGLR